MRRVQVYAHRGFWKAPSDQNTVEAHVAALERGWGTEVDLRDVGAEPVLLHDPSPDVDPARHGRFSDFLGRIRTDTRLALNLKSTGLLPRIQGEVGLKTARYFLFDLPGPEQWFASKLGLPFFTRVSPFEQGLDFAKESRGLVVDSFGDRSFLSWIRKRITSLPHLPTYFFISDEIHGMDPQDQWSWLRELALSVDSEFAICTDRPEKAETFFGGTP